jgi:hypothetical protein
MSPRSAPTWAVAAALAAAGLAVFGLSFLVGRLTSDTSPELARATPIAATPASADVTRLPAASALPDLRARPKRKAPRVVQTTPPAAAPAPKRRTAPRPRPRPVTIVGSG